jgi:hypothetical protein
LDNFIRLGAVAITLNFEQLGGIYTERTAMMMASTIITKKSLTSSFTGV